MSTIGKPASESVQHRYKPVSTNENGIQNNTTADEDRREKVKYYAARLDHYWSKARQTFWVTVALTCLYFTNIFHVLFNCEATQGAWLNISVVGFMFNAVLFVYIGLICPLLGLRSPDDEYSFVVPVATFIALATFIATTVSMWPLYGFWSMFIELALILGFANMGNLVEGKLGSFVMIAGLLLAIFSPWWIPHSGMWHKEEICFERRGF